MAPKGSFFSRQAGKLRSQDAPLLKKTVAVLKRHGLRCGLHGTSLWNPKYKDVDLIVVKGGPEHSIPEFLSAIEELKIKLGAQVIEQKGDASIGYDLDIRVGTMVLHVSYVIFL